LALVLLVLVPSLLSSCKLEVLVCYDLGWSIGKTSLDLNIMAVHLHSQQGPWVESTASQDDCVTRHDHMEHGGIGNTRSRRIVQRSWPIERSGSYNVQYRA
jgi:hypothetical protein